MRKYIDEFVFVIIFVFLCTSCISKYDYENLFPSEYDKILSIKNYGENIFDVNPFSESSSFEIVIMKGGAFATETSVANIEQLSDNELITEYGYKKEDYKIVSQDIYTINEPEIYFSEKEQHKLVNVSVSTEKIIDEINRNGKDNKYLLPLKVVSEDSVLTSKRSVVLEINILTPTISIVNLPSSPIRLETEVQTITLDANISVPGIIPDKCSCLVEYAGDDYVNSYNQLNATDYLVMPENAYEIKNINFNIDDKNVPLELVVKKELLKKNTTYVLPVKITNPSLNGVKVNDSIYYILIYNPSRVYLTEDCNCSNWNIIFCNSQAEDYKVTNILDNDNTTFWHSSWEGSYGDSMPDCYNYSFKEYHLFDGVRNLPITIVIDMNEELWLHSIGFVQRPNNPDSDIKGIEFYVSNDANFNFKPIKEGGDKSDYSDVALNDWFLILSNKSVPHLSGIIWNEVSDDVLSQDVKGRFLKIKLTDSYHPSQGYTVAMSEIYAKKVISVDGVPVK